MAFQDSLKLSEISNYMSTLVKDYNNIRYSKRSEFDFWDIVVLTATNQEQKEAYELIIKSRLNSNNPLPSGVTYLVIADPPGCRVGNGGSTFHVLSELENLFGEKLFSSRVLLIHCGGLSQRLPSTSILGKIFAPVPTGQPILEFIDIKLCNYMPFVKNMKPGILLVPSDDIQPFAMQDKFLPSHCYFDKSGFTVLAHPSTLEIGTKHGVYVLDTEGIDDPYASMVSVKRVLQKPTVSAMQAANAIVRFKGDQQMCFSDSCFYFCHRVTKKLLNFYEKIKPLDCEVDAYGDFLQCLGQSGTSDYITDQRNVSHVSKTLRETRIEVYRLLHDEPVQALVLSQSAYVHFGTMPEYIYNMVDPDYVLSQGHSSNLGLRHFFEPYRANARSTTVVDCYLHSSFGCNVPVCLMKSVIGNNVDLKSPCCVIEYSVLTSPISIGSECIISQCFWRHSAKALTVTDGTFLYTLAVSDHGFATIACGIYDDLKRLSQLKDLKYLNGKIDYFSLARKFKIFNSNETNLNLWHAKLFTIHKTPEEAFAHTVCFVNSVLNGVDKEEYYHMEYFSIAELIAKKDVKEVIKIRQQCSF